MGDDNRGFPRSLVDLKVKIQSRNQWVDCKLLDFSVEGISLEVRFQLSMGDLISIELEHREWMKKNQVEVEVIRCDSNPNKPTRKFITW